MGILNLMKNRRFILLFLVMLLSVANFQSSLFNFQPSTICAQNSKKVRDLKNQKAKLENDLKRSKNDLTKTRNDVKKGQKTIQYLDQEIEVRVRYIHQTEHELDSLQTLVDSVTEDIRVLDSILVSKKQKYTKALRMAMGYRKVRSSLLFALSADDVTQMYRRLRYTRQYASFERSLGEAVQEKQIELLELQNQLLALKSEMNRKMRILVEERAKLNRQQVEQQKQVNSLQKKANVLQKQVSEQQAKINALQKKIDEVIAYEIEQARKKAEEERRRREAEAKKKGTTGKSTTTTEPKSGSSSGSPSRWLTPEDQKLNGSFVQNKGKLPVPITGEYMIGARFGANTSGHSHVVLNSKGINYIGRQGARARTIFDGEVSAVFAFGGMKNVLVRHGSYISVYCNLSSVIVHKGQKVRARDLLGTVADDGTGQYVLHFQLRQETKLLNPEGWIGR